MNSGNDFNILVPRLAKKDFMKVQLAPEDTAKAEKLISSYIEHGNKLVPRVVFFAH